jgi:alpha-L-fucosidase 2
MFVQSYQQNIHIFPNWPVDQDASFGNLNACGGFLISSQVSQGQVTYVQIESNAGQECRLVNPWPRATVKVSSNQRPGDVLSGPLLKFTTRIKEVVVLTPGR